MFKEKVRIFLWAGSSLFVYLLGPVIHIYTIVIAYYFGGKFPALVSLFFPAVAQIYWFIRVWMITGTVINLYCLAIIGFVIFLVVAMVGGVMLGEKD